MKKILYFLPVLFLSACSSFFGVNDNVTTPVALAPGEEDRLDSAFCQQDGVVTVDNEDFRLNEDGVGYGQFSLFGSVLEQEEVEPFSGATVNAVYLTVVDDGGAAFDYFQSYAEKNENINKMVDGKLYFKLGVLENGELKSGATFTEGTAENLLSMRGSGDLTVKMLQAITLGSGASEYSVMPCVIDAN
ncbi:hypothetical protein A2974_01425 [Candidatus Peregrinibacteria bacterium RIFCSPLOWO2_01_FULL_48_20]|nr:MAG: hypothetical protein A2974_01425 [Candidatus Peregrinibacteria bacterium RIFCSPLOWO2_01_FULL_48_20]